MKKLLGYIFCILIACAIAAMIDGSGGVMIAAILILALIFSQLLLFYQRSKINAVIDCRHKMLSKGDRFEVDIKLGKKTILPTSFIEIELDCSPQLKAVDKTVFRLALASASGNETLTAAFTAFHSGKTYVGIKRIQLLDFLGLTRRDIILSDDDLKRIELRILPNIPDTGTQSEIIKSTSQNGGFDENEEETSESAIGSTGMPGYEHRVYSPGDPIKKINWKLSSKRDIYMVRLDEKLAVSSQVFILDCPYFENMTETDYCNLDNIIEGCLAMLAMLVYQGLESELYYCIGGWQHAGIKSANDLLALQEQLSGFISVTPAERLPSEAFKNGGAVCFTTVDTEHSSLAAELFENKELMLVVHENSGFNPLGLDMWECSKDFEFKKLC